MATKHKKNKFKKAKYQDKAEGAPEWLVEEGTSAIEEGNARKAIDLLKLASKKNGMTDEIRISLFKAYALRAEQLKTKGLYEEAAVVMRMMAEFKPTSASLTAETLPIYLPLLSDSDALHLYKEYSSSRGREPQVEAILAGRLFIRRHWSLLEHLEADSPLRHPMAIIEKAGSLMDQGEWERALETLKPIPRSSPYAPVRLLGKAMVAFYADDDVALKKTLSLLPQENPLWKLLEPLGRPDSENGDGVRFQPVSGPCWEGTFQLKEQIGALTKALATKEHSAILHSAQSIAETLFPEDPGSAMVQLAEMVVANSIKQAPVTKQTIKLIHRLLPGKEAAILTAKANFFSFLNLFNTAEAYWLQLKNEFPDDSDLKIAQSHLLHKLIIRSQRDYDSVQNDFYDYRAYLTSRSAFGVMMENFDDALIDLAALSIRLDPRNKEGYHLLLQIPRQERYAKDRVEDQLKGMIRYFPDDPFPHLQLADIHYEKNAFRKAEKALERALEIAPHDQRVIDRHVTALLFTVDKNLKKGLRQRVVQDLEKASTFKSPKLTPYLAEKKAFAAMMHGDDKADHDTSLQITLRDLSLTQKIRALIAFETDIAMKKIHAPLFQMALKRAFPHKKEVMKLGSTDVLSLLLPLETILEKIYPGVNMLSAMLKSYPSILSILTNEDLIRLIESSFKEDYLSAFDKELKERSQSASAHERGLIDFCGLVIESVQKNRYHEEPFRKILADATPELASALRNFAAKLSFSPLLAHTLKEALRSFRFDMMDRLNGPQYDLNGFPDPLDFTPDMLDDLTDDLFDMFLDQIPQSELKQLKKEIEQLIDHAGLRNAPEHLIRKRAKEMIKEEQLKGPISFMLKLLNHQGILKGLSKEARILLEEALL
jgi:tetratricopeptide (TPR) repeat protein